MRTLRRWRRSVAAVSAGMLAGALVVLFNPATGAGTRKWLKDHLFGSEEEFDYSTPNY